MTYELVQNRYTVPDMMLGMLYLLRRALGRGNASSRLERQPLDYGVQRHVINARFRIDPVEIREASRGTRPPTHHQAIDESRNGSHATVVTGEEQMMFVYLGTIVR
jgi:hypothetical protein